MGIFFVGDEPNFQQQFGFVLIGENGAEVDVQLEISCGDKEIIHLVEIHFGLGQESKAIVVNITGDTNGGK